MSAWTKARLDQMITDHVEENLSLDYKRADALANTDGRKAEITKDVSAMANSAGGVLIYGIAEPDEKTRRHLPERLDPLRRADVSKEWLDQIIQTIQPRIEGVVIHPVPIDEATDTVCYVVVVPQSHTAHQARDHVYYKRHNFSLRPMEDYEVRDVMNRRTSPLLKAWLFVNKPNHLVLVKLCNIGRVLARDVMVEIELPYEMDGLIIVEGGMASNDGAGREFQILRLRPDTTQSPIFPESYIILRSSLHLNPTLVNLHSGFGVSTDHVNSKVYADEMKPLRAKLEIAPVLAGWTPIEDATPQQ